MILGADFGPKCTFAGEMRPPESPSRGQDPARNDFGRVLSPKGTLSRARGSLVGVRQSCPSEAEWLRQVKSSPPEPHGILWMLNRRGHKSCRVTEGRFDGRGTFCVEERRAGWPGQASLGFGGSLDWAMGVPKDVPIRKDKTLPAKLLDQL